MCILSNLSYLCVNPVNVLAWLLLEYFYEHLVLMLFLVELVFLINFRGKRIIFMPSFMNQKRSALVVICYEFTKLDLCIEFTVLVMYSAALQGKYLSGICPMLLSQSTSIILLIDFL